MNLEKYFKLFEKKIIIKDFIIHNFNIINKKDIQILDDLLYTEENEYFINKFDINFLIFFLLNIKDELLNLKNNKYINFYLNLKI
jgi:hypothetical protein